MALAERPKRPACVRRPAAPTAAPQKTPSARRPAAQTARRRPKALKRMGPAVQRRAARRPMARARARAQIHAARLFGRPECAVPGRTAWADSPRTGAPGRARQEQAGAAQRRARRVARPRPRRAGGPASALPPQQTPDPRERVMAAPPPRREAEWGSLRPKTARTSWCAEWTALQTAIRTLQPCCAMHLPRPAAAEAAGSRPRRSPTAARPELALGRNWKTAAEAAGLRPRRSPIGTRPARRPFPPGLALGRRWKTAAEAVGSRPRRSPIAARESAAARPGLPPTRWPTQAPDPARVRSWARRRAMWPTHAARPAARQAQRDPGCAALPALRWRVQQRARRGPGCAGQAAYWPARWGLQHAELPRPRGHGRARPPWCCRRLGSAQRPTRAQALQARAGRVRPGAAAAQVRRAGMLRTAPPARRWLRLGQPVGGRTGPRAQPDYQAAQTGQRSLALPARAGSPERFRRAQRAIRRFGQRLRQPCLARERLTGLLQSVRRGSRAARAPASGPTSSGSTQRAPLFPALRRSMRARSAQAG